jgi:PTH1 family peptidyl-tRNA hydrolase
VSPYRKYDVTAVPRQSGTNIADACPSEWTLIAGLGNPGVDYAAHRHNIGFRCIDALAEIHAIRVAKKRFKGVYGEGHIGSSRVILLKPQTFMNDSGASVVPVGLWYKVPPDRIVVICDDLDLPFGRIRLRPSGSGGGHNGIRSIIAELGREDFPRIRVGIGRPSRGDPIDYVLNAFDRDQSPYLPDISARVNDILVTLLGQGIKEAMNIYNGLGSIMPDTQGK